MDRGRARKFKNRPDFWHRRCTVYPFCDASHPPSSLDSTWLCIPTEQAPPWLASLISKSWLQVMHGKLVLVVHDRDEACLRDLERMDPQSPAKLGLRWPGKGIIRSSHELLDLSYFLVFCFVLFFFLIHLVYRFQQPSDESSCCNFFKRVSKRRSPGSILRPFPSSKLWVQMVPMGNGAH